MSSKSGIGRSPETSFASNALLQFGKCVVVKDGLPDHALVVRKTRIDCADSQPRLFQISQHFHVIALAVAHSSTSKRAPGRCEHAEQRPTGIGTDYWKRTATKHDSGIVPRWEGHGKSVIRSNLCVQEGLCGEKHQYLPSEVILGRPNELATKKQRGVRLGVSAGRAED